MRRLLSDRENRTGAFVVLVFAWAPFWMISGLVIGGKTAAEVGLYVAVAPFAVTAALFVLTVFGAPFFISKPLERLGAILIMGGLAYWLFGATDVALYLAALPAAWLLRDGWRAFKSRDRKSVGEGKSVSGSVDVGGGGIRQ